MRNSLILLLIGLFAAQANAERFSVCSDTLSGIKDTIAAGSVIMEGRPGAFDMITNLPGDWWRWSKQTFTVSQLPVIGALTAVTVASVLTDNATWVATAKPYNTSTFVHNLYDYGVDIGDGRSQFALAGAFAVAGFVFNDDRAIRTASQTVEVILASGGVVQLLKHLTGRESPFLATTPTGAWRLFPNQIDYLKHTPKYDAFPSGHIATAFATFTVVAENYPEQKWIPYVGYPLMALTATGLVGTSIHWWSDIPLGIALGYSFGVLVSHPEAKNDQSEHNSNIGVSVRSDGGPELTYTLKLQ